MHHGRITTNVLQTRSPFKSKDPHLVELQQLGLVNGSDSELSFDGGDERRSLEKGAGQTLQRARRLLLTAGDVAVETRHAHVLLSGAAKGREK